MWAEVKKGPTRTRFRIEVELDNGSAIYRIVIVNNEDLERYPKLYGYTLDRITEELDNRLKDRFQKWMR